MTTRMLSRRALLASLVIAGSLPIVAACGGAPASPTAAPAKPAEPTKPAASAPEPTKPAAAAPTTAPAATTAPTAPAATTAPAAATVAPTAAPAAKTAGAKTLRMGINVPPIDFNPQTAVNIFQLYFHYLTFSQLTQPDPEKQEFVPDLAESWKLAPDGSSITFALRKDAKWHDGKPVTARDVAFTYTMGLSGATGSNRAGAYALIKGGADFTAGKAEKVAGINVVDDYTIRFDMEFPNGLFLRETSFRSQILPEHLLGRVAPAEFSKQAFFQNAPVGSGPFKFVKYTPDQSVELEANPAYHFGKPKIDRIVLNIIKSPDTMEVALTRGDLEHVYTDGGPLPVAVYEKFVKDPRFKLIGNQGGAVIGYGFNVRKDYLKSPALRQAFLHALDRKKLVDRFNAGNGTVWNSFMTHPWYQKPEWASLYPFDPAKAKALLQEARWDSNRELTVNILPVSNEDQRSMLAAQQQMLADVGIKIKFQEMDVAVWVDKFYEKHDYELAYVTYGVFPDPDGFLYWHMQSKSKNGFGYANPELDAKIEAGRRATDQKDRIRVYQEINEEMLKAVPLAVVYMENLRFIMSRRWSVPPLDKLTPATSLADVSLARQLNNALDPFITHPELWDLKEG